MTATPSSSREGDSLPRCNGEHTRASASQDEYQNDVEKTMTYYEILGVPSTATAAQLKASYRTLVLQHHPDKAQEGHFHQIQEAWECLRQEDRRRSYDEELRRRRDVLQRRLRTATTISLSELELCRVAQDEDDDDDDGDNDSDQDGANHEIVETNTFQEENEEEELIYLFHCRCGDVIEIEASDMAPIQMRRSTLEDDSCPEMEREKDFRLYDCPSCSLTIRVVSTSC